jgi:large subunit ribosomal protein L18
MKQTKRISLRKKLRARRTRSKISGTDKRPRLSIFRSNKFIYAQLVDDVNSKTLVAGSTKNLLGDNKDNRTLTKTARSEALGQLLAEEAKKVGIKTVVFDKGSYKYHGRVKAVAEGARKGGLKF